MRGLKDTAAPFAFGRLEAGDAARASDLILTCFWRFNAEQYGDNTRAFTDLVTPAKLLELARTGIFLVAKAADGALCGVICITPENHLELLFVGEAYHRRGLATALWQRALEIAAPDPGAPVEITVNASDHAIALYERLGFVRTPFERPIVKRFTFRRAPSP